MLIQLFNLQIYFPKVSNKIGAKYIGLGLSKLIKLTYL